MSKTFRILTVLAVMAGVGEFLIGFRLFVSETANGPAGGQVQQYQATPNQENCDITPYRERIERERDRFRNGEVENPGELLFLGESYRYRVFYDYSLDDVFCRPIDKPTQTRVLGPDSHHQSLDDFVIYWASIVALVSLAGLIITRILRDDGDDR